MFVLTDRTLVSRFMFSLRLVVLQQRVSGYATCKEVVNNKSFIIPRLFVYPPNGDFLHLLPVVLYLQVS